MSHKRIIISKEKIHHDREIPGDKRTFDLLTNIANTIDPNIQWTNVVPSDSPKGTVPFLDTQLWLDFSDPELYPNGKIMFSHYEKEMNSELVMQTGTAIGDRQVRTSHTQDVIRIMRNCIQDLCDELKNEHLSNYMQKLKNSGYQKPYRLEILKSAEKGYQKQKKDDTDGTKPLYRPRGWKMNERKQIKENLKRIGLKSQETMIVS